MNPQRLKKLRKLANARKHRNISRPVKTHPVKIINHGTKIIQPIRPLQPVQPIQPLQIIQPIPQPLQIIQPVQSVQVTREIQPIQPVQVTREIQPVQPVQVTREIQPVQSVQVTREIQPIQPVQVTQPVQVVQPVQVTQPVPTTQPTSNVKIYLGDNVHSYTHQIQGIAESHQCDLVKKYGEKLENGDFEYILGELIKIYGEKPAFTNIRGMFRDGGIKDPEIPTLNSALLLKALYEFLKITSDKSILAHFGETLDQIGMTCIQGITHRLFIDYIVFCTN